MIAYVGFASFLAQVFIKRREKRESKSVGVNNLLKTQIKVMSFMVIPVAILVPITLPNMLNNSYDEGWKSKYISSDSNQVEVKLRVAAIHNVPNGDVNNLALLGTTDKFVFFYSKPDKKVVIVPIGNVLFIQHS